MSETIPFTDVIDAADGPDRFDLAVHLDFTRTTEQGEIRRETHRNRSRPIAKHEATRSELMFGLDIGLFKDLMATFRMPLIISDERSLTAIPGRSPDQVQVDLNDPVGGGMGNQPLFRLADGSGRSTAFDSPTRAGLDYVGIGFAWGVINQMRRPHLPTLVFIVEGRIAVGEPMHPCEQFGDATNCGNPGTGDFDNDAGSSRGTNGFRFEARTSHRYRYVEPYGGIGVLVQWPSKAKDSFWPAGDVDGYIHRLPSQRVKTQLGAVFIPWENRARFQRFGMDLQVHGTYVTEGHDYTALFDALGTSDHPHLATPLPEGDLSENDSLNTGTFQGLTDVEGHFRYGLKVGLEMQAAEYVRFQFGSSLNWVTTHALTSADPCNPDVDPTLGDPRAGACGSGVINPHHRATIDLPGRRFLMDGLFVYDIHFGAVAQF